MATPEQALAALKARLEAEPKVEVRLQALLRVKEQLEADRLAQRETAIGALKTAAVADPTYQDLRLSDVKDLLSNSVLPWS